MARAKSAALCMPQLTHNFVFHQTTLAINPAVDTVRPFCLQIKNILNKCIMMRCTAVKYIEF